MGSSVRYVVGEEQESKWELYRIPLQGSFCYHIALWMSAHLLFHVLTSLMLLPQLAPQISCE